jgi:ubiquinone/menaquinone biosynthesis C-methylase UbiE
LEKEIAVTTSEAFQLDLAAAEAYEERFVPAMFAEWAELLVAEAGVEPGQRVLDVACGTGIAARRAADIVGASSVTGLDINEAMLTVAARVRPDITWLPGDAAALPFSDMEFDAVLCQMALMFFPDPLAAVREMRRVVSDGGTITAAVPAQLEEQPAYGPFVELVGRRAGTDALSLLDTYWACGDADRMRQLFHEARLTVTSLRSHSGTARYTSADDFVAVEVESTPLIDRLSREQYARVREGTVEVLRPFTDRDGAVTVPLHGLLIVARR